MKRVLLSGVALAALLGPAAAADLPRREVVAKAPAYIATIYNWTGPYIGINAGGGWGRSSFSAPFPSGTFDVSGGMLGGTLGYNWQAGAMVFGLESDLDWSNLRGSTTCGGVACDVRNSWLGTVRGRLGLAWDRVMPYVTGGLAIGDIRTNVAGIGSGSSTKTGWTLGAGLEFALSGPWTAKVEYLYADLGRGGGIAGTDAALRTNIVRAGVNYRF
ncbi:MAG: outer rane immunogenic protein [Alphaproteobacteria bacterium]|nr:outer rane immunogenic protein [Alphaproteobacteria bacterium]